MKKYKIVKPPVPDKYTIAKYKQNKMNVINVRPIIKNKEKDVKCLVVLITPPI